MKDFQIGVVYPHLSAHGFRAGSPLDMGPPRGRAWGSMWLRPVHVGLLESLRTQTTTDDHTVGRKKKPALAPLSLTLPPAHTHACAQKQNVRPDWRKGQGREVHQKRQLWVTNEIPIFLLRPSSFILRPSSSSSTPPHHLGNLLSLPEKSVAQNAHKVHSIS